MNIVKTEDGVVHQTGSVTRVTFGAPTPEEQAASLARSTEGPIRVGNQIHRFQANGTEEVLSTVSRHQVEAEAPVNAGSVLATKRTQGGKTSVQLIPGNESSRTDIAVAVREGLLVEVSPGHFMDAAVIPHAPVQAPKAQPQAPAGADAGATAGEDQPWSFIDPKEIAMWNEDMASLPPQSLHHAVASTVAAIASGKDFDHVARQLAESAGMEPEVAAQYVNEGTAFMKDHLTKDLIRGGLLTKGSAEDFYSSLVGHPKLSRALQEVAFEGKTSTFRELATEYKRTGAQRTEEGMRSQFKAAGFETSVTRKGELMVKRGNGPWIAASELASGG